MRSLVQRSLILSAFLFLLLSTPTTATNHCEFRLGFATLRDLIGHDIVGDCLENEHYNHIGDSNQQTTGGLMAWRKADNWTAFTDGYRTWINGPNGLVVRLNTERFPWEADYAPGGGVATPVPQPTPVPLSTPTPAPVAWPGVSTVPVGVPHRFTHDGETWEVTVLEVMRGQAVVDQANLLKRSNKYIDYTAPKHDEEDVAVKYRVKLAGINTLGENKAFFNYHICVGTWIVRCSSAQPTSLIMESGSQGSVHPYPDFVGNPIEWVPYLSIGDSVVGWQAWRIWKGMNVVLVIHMDDDQKDMSQYSAIFSLS